MACRCLSGHKSCEGGRESDAGRHDGLDNQGAHDVYGLADCATSQRLHISLQVTTNDGKTASRRQLTKVHRLDDTLPLLSSSCTLPLRQHLLADRALFPHLPATLRLLEPHCQDPRLSRELYRLRPARTVRLVRVQSLRMSFSRVFEQRVQLAVRGDEESQSWRCGEEGLGGRTRGRRKLVCRRMQRWEGASKQPARLRAVAT